MWNAAAPSLTMITSGQLSLHHKTTLSSNCCLSLSCVMDVPHCELYNMDMSYCFLVDAIEMVNVLIAQNELCNKNTLYSGIVVCLSCNDMAVSHKIYHHIWFHSYYSHAGSMAISGAPRHNLFRIRYLSIEPDWHNGPRHSSSKFFIKSLNLNNSRHSNEHAVGDNKKQNLYHSNLVKAI